MAHDPLETALREGRALLDKAAAEAPQAQADSVRHYGQPFALGWGMLRAIYECPDCPGSFRVPLKADPNTIVCPNCCGVWEYVGK
jgi:hypothetical protein